MNIFGVSIREAIRHKAFWVGVCDGIIYGCIYGCVFVFGFVVGAEALRNGFY